LLNFLPANPSDDCAARAQKVFAMVCIAGNQRVASTAANAGAPPNLRYTTYVETVGPILRPAPLASKSRLRGRNLGYKNSGRRNSQMRGVKMNVDNALL
jgi:hypothetical protein